MVHDDVVHPRKTEKLASYHITNKSCTHCDYSSLSPSPPAVFFMFDIKFQDEDWFEDQNSPVLIAKSDGAASARAAVDELSFSRIHGSIGEALKRVGLHDDHCRLELILFAWNVVAANFLKKSIEAAGINGFTINIEVVVRRRRATVAPSLSCSICLEDFSGDPNQFLRMPCSHFFHSRCIIPWLNRTMRSSCPLCRTKIRLCRRH
ncbi:hypothetical protein C2S51_036407 [Perilla frutescens var. frutescens]|nr:hypothetical protein C2S51_036407 [Perilla frutescens var. frutescens]